jgi:hypothetical protein
MNVQVEVFSAVVGLQQGNKFYDCLLHLVGCFIRVMEDAWNHEP